MFNSTNPAHQQYASLFNVAFVVHYHTCIHTYVVTRKTVFTTVVECCWVDSIVCMQQNEVILVFPTCWKSYTIYNHLSKLLVILIRFWMLFRSLINNLQTGLLLLEFDHQSGLQYPQFARKATTEIGALERGISSTASSREYHASCFLVSSELRHSRRWFLQENSRSIRHACGGRQTWNGVRLLPC